MAGVSKDMISHYINGHTQPDTCLMQSGSQRSVSGRYPSNPSKIPRYLPAFARSLSKILFSGICLFRLSNQRLPGARLHSGMSRITEPPTFMCSAGLISAHNPDNAIHLLWRMGCLGEVGLGRADLRKHRDWRWCSRLSSVVGSALSSRETSWPRLTEPARPSTPPAPSRHCPPSQDGSTDNA